jgi:hypothetical protein
LRCDEEITLGLLNTLFILFCRFWPRCMGNKWSLCKLGGQRFGVWYWLLSVCIW